MRQRCPGCSALFWSGLGWSVLVWARFKPGSKYATCLCVRVCVSYLGNKLSSVCVCVRLMYVAFKLFTYPGLSAKATWMAVWEGRGCGGCPIDLTVI